MSRLCLTVCFALSIACVTSGVSAGAEFTWPRWRGPQQDGHLAEGHLPTKWSDKNIVWRTPLPGIGQSSPIIWGDRIFLTSTLNKGQERLVFCVDRKSGKILWEKTAWKGEPEPSHAMNGWASASCVTDGQVVVAFFGRGGLHAYTVNGEHLWSLNLGRFESPWGTAACPILVDDLVIQNCDADEDAYLAAFDKQTGKQVWRTKRRDHRGWSTPILIHTAERRELVLNGHEGVQAYDPASGRELWFCRSFNGRGEPTITPAGDLLLVVNGLAGDFYSVRPGGSGDVTSTHMAWHTPRKGGRDCPSPIVVADYTLVCDMTGIATCYSVADGHIYWKERLAGKFSGSPIVAGELIYLMNEAGTTFVIKPGPKLNIIAENGMTAQPDEIFRATPTPCNNQILIRSTTALYCIGDQ